MSSSTVHPPFDLLLATARKVSRERADVDPELAHEVFLEAATLLHNGLALDGLDDHDARLVVAGLCEDLLAEDPGAAVRGRARALRESPGDAHDATRVANSLLVSATILQL